MLLFGEVIYCNKENDAMTILIYLFGILHLRYNMHARQYGENKDTLLAQR